MLYYYCHILQPTDLRDKGPSNHANCNYPDSHDDLLNPKFVNQPQGFNSNSNFQGNTKSGRNLDPSNGIGLNSVQPFSKPNYQSGNGQQQGKVYKPNQAYNPPASSAYSEEYVGPAMQLVSSN